MSKPAPQPLESRHVFLDTQVYRKLGHNVANPALRTLARHIADRKLVLHTTDIMLLEVKRQIAEDVEARARELGAIEKTLRRWRHTVPAIAPTPAIDAPAVAGALFHDFERALREWSAMPHAAFDIPAATVFADYFARTAPFDLNGSKEFPDAFMLKALEKWCEANRVSLHVVTQDKAMTRAVGGCQALRHIATIEELLERASIQPDIDTEQLAVAVLNAPEFDYYLEETIAAKGDDLVFEYQGELPEGEVVGHEVRDISAVSHYSVAWVGAESICLILDVETGVTVTVHYEDRDRAAYDREDDRWYGVETANAELPTIVTIELFLEMELATRRVISSELLRTEYPVAEHYERMR